MEFIEQDSTGYVSLCPAPDIAGQQLDVQKTCSNLAERE